MHEMALAQGILDIALDYAAQEKATRISTVGLKIGAMSGVETEALEMSFRLISVGTVAEGAELKITRIPLVGKCHKCGRELPIEAYNFWCPTCDNGVLKIISGREMQVDYLEIDDASSQQREENSTNGV